MESEGLKLAADRLSLLTSVPEDAALVARVAQKAKDRVDQKNEAYADLVSPLLLSSSALTSSAAP